MSIEKIREKILSEAEEKKESLLLQANQQKEKILQEAEEEASRQRQNLLRSAELEAYQQLENILSQERLKQKKELLAFKRTLLNRVFAKIEKRIGDSLPYKTVILKDKEKKERVSKERFMKHLRLKLEKEIASLLGLI